MKTMQSNRITARVNPDQLKLLNDAVNLSGSSSLNNFILTSAIAEAKRVIIEDRFLKSIKEQEAYEKDQIDPDVLVLNKAEALELFKALENEAHSNSNLRALINLKKKDIHHVSRTNKVRGYLLSRKNNR